MNKKWMIIGISFLICILGVFYLFSFQENEPKIFTVEEKEASKNNGAFFLTETEEMPVEETIQVYICGEVNCPGVYTVEQDKRLADLVELCQGFTEKAAVTAINLAGKLTDGEKIYIPSLEEEKDRAEETVSDGKININTATQEQLMSLPGIGKAKAAVILAFRENHGAFGSIEELMQVEGIKEGIYNKIKDFVKV